MKAREKRYAFTLLEVMVALTVTGLVLTAVIMSLGAWARANDRAREYMEMYRTLQKVMDRTYYDVGSIYVSPYNTPGLREGFETFDIETFREPYDAFTFTSLSHRAYKIDAKESEMIEMTYFTVADEEGFGPEGTRIIRRREGGVIDDNFEVTGGTVYDMAAGVTFFSFDYLGPDGELRHEWRLSDQAGKLPCAVVVKMGLASYNIEEIRSCSVIPVHLTNNLPCTFEPETLQKLCEE